MKKLAFVLLALAALSPLLHAEKPADSKTDTSAVVKGNTQAALDLYAQLREKEGNLFFSPYSISTALAMTYMGARGETAEEMARALHFPSEQLAPAFGALHEHINGGDKKRGYQLSTANALWGQQGYDFREEFIKTTRKYFGAGLREVAFRTAPEESRQTINRWVEKETRDKIKDLLPRGTITPDTRLVLTNAIYFKGDWAEQFKKDRTRDEPFKLSSEKSVKVPLMHKTDRFGYVEGDGFQALELPYKGKELSMVVLLPKKVDGLTAFEKGLSAEKLAGWLRRLRQQEVIVALPKFKMTSQFSLNEVLKKMGMKRAFTPRADFSGMNGRSDLSISAVVHKAFVEVNEEGTEAAAATGIVVGVTSAVQPRPKPVFRADHPCVFLIRDRATGSVLFMGRLANPKE